MRTLVTGATGFIGGHLCERLLQDGHEVLALVRSPDKATRLLELGATALPGDLSIFAEHDRELPEVDLVVHLAGVVSAPSPEHYEAINHDAVVDLLSCLGRQSWRPRRLLFASSLAAAGPSPEGRPWTEADTPAPIDPYGRAKARAEEALREAAFPVTCFRPPLVLGPGDPAFLTVFQMARRGLGVRVSGPAQRLSWVWVGDLVEAMLTMAADERPGHRIYFTSSEEVITLPDLYEALGTAFNHKLIVVPVPTLALRAASSMGGFAAKALGRVNQLDAKQVAQMTAPAFVCTSARLTEELGWTAPMGFQEAIVRTKLGYEAQGWL